MANETTVTTKLTVSELDALRAAIHRDYAWKVEGDWKIADNGARAHITAKIGARSEIGARSKIGAYSKIGASSKIGARSTFVFDLGFADGYRKVLCSVNGVAFIGAGCRWFCLADAVAHWSKAPDRAVTSILMQTAVALAKHYNLKESK